MRREDLECLVVFRFEQGAAPSAIDRAMRLHDGESRLVVVKWWRLMKGRAWNEVEKEGA